MNFFKQAGNYLTLFKTGRIGNVEEGIQDNDVVIKKQLDALGTTRKKIYKALLTQSGTDAPVPTVLENTLGNVTYGYVATGRYSASLTGVFLSNKTAPTISTVGLEFSGCVRSNDDVIAIKSADSTGALSNDILQGNVFEICVYD